MKASASSRTFLKAAADAVYMDRALELAAHGVALSSPNPMVGAVLVRDGKLVGEGFHTYDGMRHAEIVALEAAARQAGENFDGVAAAIPSRGVNPAGAGNDSSAARGATLYINLEPCCHTGRTGPCTQAVIDAGVTRVVAAMADPNPEVAGRGFQQLRAAGIEVCTGLREAEARRLNEAFAKWIVSRKPLVTLKSALTLDGQLVLAHPRGRARPPLKDRWISSPESRAEVQRMRHASDALVTGIGTVLGDDPLLTDRTGLPRRRKLLRVVMDSRLRLPLRSKLVRSADGDVLVFTQAKENSAKARALRRAGVEVVRVAGRGSRPDLRAVIAELGRREILSVLLESGAALNSAALSAGIVDKMRVFYAPKVSGLAVKRPGTAAPSNSFLTARVLQNITMAQFGVDFSIEGYFHNVYRTR
ncbi:MAG TPA: bifunctional diaminohydroxyphosphoribosylaminopyrimidine deaminase/5-amino-6-(5-phosphoribosylamino)uracil reductase RibD [Candidatus Dormibacteraeota bacterium]|nr:bifunctional diaminohydroxyphosphoribosylaminopyrimidine deaminase/5-amino-6-(5-phosphoribosylamino)uracil reductase RibD [Candidatus Dormibacteraeota bacterium]